MDLNADGHLDILSGTYSRMSQEMAGTFQVLWGSDDGFRVAEELNGTDDEPLIIPADESEMLEKICTRPFACDIDADGDLDLIVGNFGGTFYQFTGEGEGKFQPEPKQLMDADGKKLLVKHHSDPFMFDWDADGDLDLISGSDAGGINVAINSGSNEEAKFESFKAVFAMEKSGRFDGIVLGEEHITGPQNSTRVWIDDVNGDGKFDILVGDSATISTAAEGIEEDEIEGKLAEWQKEQQEAMEGYSEFMDKYQAAMEAEQNKKAKEEDADLTDENTDEDADEQNEEGASEEKKSADDTDEKEMTEVEKLQDQMNEFQEKMQAVYEKREGIIQDDMTGFVWVYYQK